MTTVSDVLEAAADHIRIQGHHKGDYAPGAVDALVLRANTPKCAMGAIYFVADRVQLAHAACSVLSGAIGLSIVAWNDHVSTTPDQVVDTILEVAKDLRNGETLP